MKVVDSDVTLRMGIEDCNEDLVLQMCVFIHRASIKIPTQMGTEKALSLTSLSTANL